MGVLSALEQATNLFKIPMTADVSIVKQDKKENFTQVGWPQEKSLQYIVYFAISLVN